MSQEQAELDRSEAATPHKLGEARKRGQVPRSAELASAGALMAGIVYFNAHGLESLQALFRFDRMLLVHAGSGGEASAAWLWQLTERAIAGAFGVMAPALAVLVTVAVAANLVQTGALLSGHPLKPDWQRINPAQGLRRLFSARTLLDALRACMKLAVLGWLTLAALKGLYFSFREVADLSTLAYFRKAVGEIASLGLQLGAALLVFALLDVGYSRFEFARKMRMSRRELRDEFKHREGDPRIRSRMRELRRGLLKRMQSLRNVSKADVVVTNPTHVAVALRYKRGQPGAPVVVSKGRGGLAAAIRALAARRRIPVVRHPSLARALDEKCALDLPIPAELYADVARLMVWLLALQVEDRPSASPAGATEAVA
jgi:flagellar biosynthetic protein FlhB